MRFFYYAGNVSKACPFEKIGKAAFVLVKIRRRKMKKLSVLFMTMILAVALVSCGGGGNDGDAAQGADEMISVTLEIEYPDDSGVADVEDVTVEISKDGTVLDALNAYSDTSGCEVVLDQSSDSPYVTSIGGVAATDTAGWVYEVNDEQVMKSADACTLKAGDEVSWSFEEWAE